MFDDDALRAVEYVINLHVYDARNHLFLTGLYLPKAFPSTPAIDSYLGTDAASVPDDDSVGRLLMLMAKKHTGARLCGTGRDYEDAGLQTWMLSPSPRRKGHLDDWFSDARPYGRFRVAIHRTPRRYGGRSLPGIWDDVHDEFGAIFPSAVPRDAGSPTELRLGLTVLEAGLAAYQRSAEAVVTWADGLGHPYTLIV